MSQQLIEMFRWRIGESLEPFAKGIDDMLQDFGNGTVGGMLEVSHVETAETEDGFVVIILLDDVGELDRESETRYWVEIHDSREYEFLEGQVDLTIEETKGRELQGAIDGVRMYHGKQRMLGMTTAQVPGGFVVLTFLKSL